MALIQREMSHCCPAVAFAGVVAAQVLFSSTCAFADKAAHDMYVLYSCCSAAVPDFGGIKNMAKNCEIFWISRDL